MLVNVHPTDPRAHALFGDILYQDDQIEQAMVEYKKSLSLDDSKFVVWQQVMLLYDREQNYDSLLVLSERSLELFRIRIWHITLMDMPTCN